MTASEIAQRILDNSEAYHNREIGYDEFASRNLAFWLTAEVAGVSAEVMAIVQAQ